MISKLHCERLEILLLELYNEKDDILRQISELSEDEINASEHEHLYSYLYNLDVSINEKEVLVNSYYATVIGEMEKEIKGGLTFE